MSRSNGTKQNSKVLLTLPQLKHLCSVESMLNRFQEYAGRNQLFSSGDTLIVGLSGGCDSMVLTHLLLKSGVTVIAAHVNYHLRGEESDGDEKFVRDWCRANNIEFRVLHASVENDGGIQEQARRARYDWFRQLRHELDAKAIAVAHHMNDQAETVLHHLARGTGLKGAMGMSPLNGDIIRPLLEFSRTEIETEAKNAGIPFRNDSSNDKDSYTRNLIRHKVIPNLEQVNPQSVRHISDYANLMGQYASAAEAWCKSWIAKHVSSDDQTLVIPINELIQCVAPDVILHHLLGTDYTHSQANEVRKLLHSTTGKHIVLGNREIVHDRGFLRIAQGNSSAFRSEIFEVPAIVHGIQMEYDRMPEVFPKGEKEKIWIDLRKVSFPIVVRNWSEGDRMQPMGMSGHQKISDILTHARIPADHKAHVPIVEMNGEVIWVAGLKVSGSIKTEEPGAPCLTMKLINSSLEKA